MKKILSLLTVIYLGATSSVPTINTINENNVSRSSLYKPYLEATADMSLTGGYGYRDKYSDTFTLYWDNMGVTGYAGFVNKYKNIKFRTEGSYMELKFFSDRKYFSGDAYRTASISSMFKKTNKWESMLYYISDKGKNQGISSAWYNGAVLIQTRTDDSGVDIRANVYIEGSRGGFGDYIKAKAILSEIELY